MGLTKPKVTGMELPVLSNAATADIIPAGYEAIDGLGVLMVGTGTGLGDAVVGNVDSGVSFTSENGLLLVGTSTKVEVLTGTVSASSKVNNLTISSAKGKTNIAIIKNDSAYNANTYFVVVAMSLIGSTKRLAVTSQDGCTLNNSTLNNYVNWTSSSGVIKSSESSVYFHGTYRYIAW